MTYFNLNEWAEKGKPEFTPEACEALKRYVLALIGNIMGDVPKVWGTSKEDIVQEVILKIWKGIDRFEGRCKLTTWIYKIVRNQIIQMAKQKEKLNTLYAISLFSQIDPENPDSNLIDILPDTRFLQQEKRIELIEELTKNVKRARIRSKNSQKYDPETREKRKKVIELRQQGLTYEQIGAKLGIPRNTVGTYVSRAGKYGEYDPLKIKNPGSKASDRKNSDKEGA